MKWFFKLVKGTSFTSVIFVLVSAFIFAPSLLSNSLINALNLCVGYIAHISGPLSHIHTHGGTDLCSLKSYLFY